jgi:hypothetical protein
MTGGLLVERRGERAFDKEIVWLRAIRVWAPWEKLKPKPSSSMQEQLHVRLFPSCLAAVSVLVVSGVCDNGIGSGLFLGPCIGSSVCTYPSLPEPQQSEVFTPPRTFPIHPFISTLTS